MEQAQTELHSVSEHFFGLVDGAFDEYSSHPPSILLNMSDRTQCSLIHDLIVKQAKVLADTTPGLTLTSNKGLWVLNVYNLYLVRFNKLNEALCASHNDTQVTIRFRGQDQVFEPQYEIPGMPKEATNVILGYKFNATRTWYKSVHVVCPSESGYHWEFEIPRPTSTTTEEPVVEIRPTGTSGGSRVRPKPEAEETGTDSGVQEDKVEDTAE